MRRMCEELDHLGIKYKILQLKDIQFPFKEYPKYVMILFLDIMQYRDDLIYGLCIMEEFERNGVTLFPPLKGMYYSDKFSNYLLWNKYLKNIIQVPDTLCCLNLETGKQEVLNKGFRTLKYFFTFFTLIIVLIPVIFPGYLQVLVYNL